MKTIKKFTALILLFIVLCPLMLFAACGEDDPGKKPPQDVVLQKIEVTTMPTKVDYYVGDTLDAEGGELTATYSDETTKKVSLTDGSVELSQPDMSFVGIKNVVVKYGGKQTTFKITVTSEKYDVTFKYNDGTPDRVVSVEKGKAVEEPTKPERDGFEFEGWFSDKSMTLKYNFKALVVEPLILYARWLDVSKNAHKFTFDFNHPDLKTPSVTLMIEEGEAAVPLAQEPERYGYEFDGWYTLADGGEAYTFSEILTGDCTVYAHWTRTLLGEHDYVFEAENTSLKGKSGPSTSGMAYDGGMVVQDLSGGASGVGFVSYLYKFGNGLDFDITSDVEVSNVSIWVRMSCELIPQTFNNENFMISVNGTAMDYGTVVFSREDVPDSGGDLGTVLHADFRDICIGTNLTLHKGGNTISVTTINDTPPGGSTWQAYAPIIDCIKIKADAVLTWKDSAGLPAYDYKV